MDKQQKSVICLMGPTASGKTDLAIALSQQLAVDIVSVDSAMVYRGMDIGTAKPDAATLAAVPHQLIDIRDPDQAYSVGQFIDDVIAIIDAIHTHQRIPLLVGGTMLYFNALQQGLSKLPAADPQIRAEIQQQADQLGWLKLHQQLGQIDPAAAQQIHSSDKQRISRALEVYRLTGQTITSLYAADKSQMQHYQFINIGLVPHDRSSLHDRIALRFQTMLADGLVEEVESLMSHYRLSADLPSMKSVGYQQVYQYLNGKLNQEEMIEKAIIATRQLAKRQLTWLRSWPDLHCYDPTDPELVAKVLQLLRV